MTINDKADYAKAAPQTRDHTCHWPGCEKQVKPAMWGCQRHWFMLPKRLRSMIWSAFRPGQEIDYDVSKEYLRVAHIVQNWIKENYPTKA